MRSELNLPHVLKKIRCISFHLESFFGRYAQEVWKKNLTDPEIRVMLSTKLLRAVWLNMYNPIGEGDDSEETL